MQRFLTATGLAVLHFLGHVSPDIVGTFERELQRLNPGRANLAYAAVDVQRWLDTLHDITALTFSEEKASYVPHDRHWVRQRVQQWVEKHT